MNKRPNRIYREFGHSLRIARELAGWSQAELAAAFGVSRSVVSRWEKGVVPSAYYYEQYRTTLGLKVKPPKPTIKAGDYIE